MLTAADTAFVTAACRALEHGLDPLAHLLAGERGQAVLASIPGATAAAGVIGVRTRVFDDLVMAAVDDGFDAVVNLGAGLDSRAYRLPLPQSLRWFDVDVAEMIEHRARALAHLRPVCHHEGVSLDVSDGPALGAFLAHVGACSGRTLVLSEGLLPYLTQQAVEQLAAALLAMPGFARWALTLASPAIVAGIDLARGGDGQGGGFGCSDGSAFFSKFGFAANLERSILPGGTTGADGARLLILEPHARQGEDAPCLD